MKASPLIRILVCWSCLFAGFISFTAGSLWAGPPVTLVSGPPVTELTRNPRWAQPVALPESDNFYQVAPGIYRSAQPTKKALLAYEAFGVKTVINLRSQHSDRELVAGTSLRLIEAPVKTWDIGDHEVIRVLRLLKRQPKPILVHCQHGADRTGLMMAMYRLVFEGWTKEEALDEMRNGGYGFHRIWRNIPQYIEEVDIEAIRRAVEEN